MKILINIATPIIVFVACMLIVSTLLIRGSRSYSPLDTYVKTMIQKQKDSAAFADSIKQILYK